MLDVCVEVHLSKWQEDELPLQRHGFSVFGNAGMQYTIKVHTHTEHVLYVYVTIGKGIQVT